MSGVYIPGDKVPTKCVGCPFRDPEYGGSCILMPSFDADTYEEQFDRCPFKEIRKWFGLVPEHVDLIDRNELEVIGYCGIPQGREDTFDSGVMWLAEQIDALPIIIPAEEGER